MHVSISPDLNLLTEDLLTTLVGQTIHGEWTNDGFPADCHLVRVEDDGIVVCEIEDDGGYRFHSTWHIGYDEIVWITVK